MTMGLDPEIYEEKYEFFKTYGKSETSNAVTTIADVLMFSFVLLVATVLFIILAIAALAVSVGDIISSPRQKLRTLWWKITCVWPWMIKRWLWSKRKSL